MHKSCPLLNLLEFGTYPVLYVLWLYCWVHSLLAPSSTMITKANWAKKRKCFNQLYSWLQQNNFDINHSHIEYTLSGLYLRRWQQEAADRLLISICPESWLKYSPWNQSQHCKCNFYLPCFQLTSLVMVLTIREEEPWTEAIFQLTPQYMTLKHYKEENTHCKGWRLNNLEKKTHHARDDAYTLYRRKHTARDNAKILHRRKHTTQGMPIKHSGEGNTPRKGIADISHYRHYRR